MSQLNRGLEWPAVICFRASYMENRVESPSEQSGIDWNLISYSKPSTSVAFLSINSCTLFIVWPPHYHLHCTVWKWSRYTGITLGVGAIQKNGKQANVAAVFCDTDVVDFILAVGNMLLMQGSTMMLDSDKPAHSHLQLVRYRRFDAAPRAVVQTHKGLMYVRCKAACDVLFWAPREWRSGFELKVTHLTSLK